ncbi:MAG: hypothetical protein KDA51_05975 [Planctomycetales bacterium]|nr:hypothetical protein [Planctomycetales bacterium]
MSERQQIGPDEALERLFAVIREEASRNPIFGRRMLDAVGVSVSFQGVDAATAADPILLAARNEFPEFREMFDTFPDKELKALIKGFGLATDQQVKAVKTKPKKIGLIELMWDGAKRKLADREGR